MKLPWSSSLTVWWLMSANAVVAATPAGARESIDARDLQRHVGFLASDTLEGRAAGTRGGQAAASYLAREFRRLGLTPAGEDRDFLQEFARGYRNVLAILPGSDPDLSREIILLGGHFDHVGYGSRENSFGPYGQIHNGADDNASGTAAILEVAEAFTHLDRPPARTVLFALWDAEEAGMLGSEHWVQQPTRPIQHVRLALNVDMIGRLRNNRVTVYGVRTAAGLRQIASLANRDSRLKLDFDWTQRQDSDHWSFYQQRIPYLMLFTGDHEDYHRPSDDVHKLNFDGLQRLSQMIFELTRRAAEREQLAGFRGDSHGEGPEQQAAAERNVTARPSRLGVAWTQRHDPSEPFVITRTVPGSPAEQAGLQSGDRILRVDGLMPEEIADLSGFVLSAHADLRLLVERDGRASPVEVTVALRGAPVRLGVSWRTDPAEPEAVIVTAVTPGSPAAKAGITSGDRIYQTHGQESAADWLRTVTSTSEDSLSLWIEREGIVREIVVALLPIREPSRTDQQLAD